ncbi:MAG TPA: M61 family peptidase [Acidobacteriaceae bacterium]
MALLAACAPLQQAHAQGAGASPITLSVDLTDAPRRLIHARLTIPVEPGKLTLLYPKWIPGEHSPTGPIDNLAGLTIMGAGHALGWERDELNMYAFHVTVPAGVSVLEVSCDFLATAPAAGFSAGASTSADVAMLSWNEVLLYPEGVRAEDQRVTASVKLPQGWQYATALTSAGRQGEQTTFSPVSIEQLVDSPLMAGRYFAEFPLAPEVSPKHYLDLVADGPEDLKLKPEALAAMTNLVHETGALYKSRHYDSYRFLVTLSDQVAHFGLEHHASSDDRLPERTFLDDYLGFVEADLLPHEFAHSWNGKYRRPAGLATGNYEDPMKGGLLWVYEGLTQYLGDVLAARSGIESAEQFREALAANAAMMDARPGRTWRDLEDTATSAQILYSASDAWDSWRRSVDYYTEGELVWLDVDTTIRKQTGNKKSLNDFCALFLGPAGNSPARVVPYTFADVVNTLNAVAPYDWAGFLKERLTSKAAHAPLGGLNSGGYKLVYNAQTNAYLDAYAVYANQNSQWWSAGLKVSADGHISDVLMQSPADLAGLGPGMQIIAINGRQFSVALLLNALTEAAGSTTPMEWIVANAGNYRIVHVEYHGGLRYPHLERVAGTPGRLDDILVPLAGRK